MGAADEGVGKVGANRKGLAPSSLDSSSLMSMTVALCRDGDTPVPLSERSGCPTRWQETDVLPPRRFQRRTLILPPGDA